MEPPLEVIQVCNAGMEFGTIAHEVHIMANSAAVAIADFIVKIVVVRYFAKLGVQ